jgi:hypothetical protein
MDNTCGYCELHYRILAKAINKQLLHKPHS